MKKNEAHHKGFAQKLLAISLCLSMLLLGIPQWQSARVKAAAEKLSLPDTAFITKDKLLMLCEETNDGKGLLATGTGSDVKLRINFGQRPEDANYYKSSHKKRKDTGTAKKGPATWLVAGSEKFTPEGKTEETDGLVLFSEGPLVSAYYLRGDSKMNSTFQPAYVYSYTGHGAYAGYWVSPRAGGGHFNAGWGTYSSSPADVYANHWGASNLRKVLKTIYEGSKLTVDGEEADYSGFFNATEKGLMAASTIATNDHQTGSAVEYTTEDILYAPRLRSTEFSPPDRSSLPGASLPPNTSVTVGGADALSIDAAHWGGVSWLRSPYPDDSSATLVAHLGYYVDFWSVDYDRPSISAAFRLDLTPVLFASAASAASSAEGGKFEKISTDTPMTLRLTAPEGSTAEVSATADEVVTRNAAGWTLMVQGVTSDGQSWSYGRTITSNDSVAVSPAVVAAAGNITLNSFDYCGIWLEKPVEDGGSLAYATRPKFPKPTIETTVTVRDGTPQRVRLDDRSGVLPLDVEFSAKYHKLSAGTPNFIFKVGEVLHAYDLTLSSGGKELSQLDAPVTLRFEAVRGIDAADAAVTRIVDGASTDLEVSRVIDGDGTVWVEITTDHFSRYILVTGRRAARILLAGIATLLILALGFTIRFIRKKKKN